MRCRLLFAGMIEFLLLFALSIPVSGVENLDRGLVALEREDSSVFLSWRLLADDPEDIAFLITRRSSEAGTNQSTLLTKGGPYRLTNFVDKSLEKGAGGKSYIYELYKYSKNRSRRSGWLGEVAITLTGRAKSYISIPLKGDYDFQKVGISDLDGDGAYEFIIKQPNFNSDPYQKPGYWKPSTTT
ncbi:unnamed protein product, partial [marine sediment metagenome]